MTLRQGEIVFGLNCKCIITEEPVNYNTVYNRYTVRKITHSIKFNFNGAVKKNGTQRYNATVLNNNNATTGQPVTFTLTDKTDVDLSPTIATLTVIDDNNCSIKGVKEGNTIKLKAVLNSDIKIVASKPIKVIYGF